MLTGSSRKGQDRERGADICTVESHIQFYDSVCSEKYTSFTCTPLLFTSESSSSFQAPSCPPWPPSTRASAPARSATLPGLPYSRLWTWTVSQSRVCVSHNEICPAPAGQCSRYTRSTELLIGNHLILFAKQILIQLGYRSWLNLFMMLDIQSLPNWHLIWNHLIWFAILI